MSIRFTLNGQPVDLEGADVRASLLDVLRGECGITSAKDGCAPQGQCGCCTVLVDGKARVSCVTPVRRVQGRKVVTLEGLASDVTDRWAAAFVANGGSQCGFCTPGIVMRLEECRLRREESMKREDPAAGVHRALAAHLCRCTGWQGICDAASELLSSPRETTLSTDIGRSEPAARRATLEGGRPQQVDARAVLGGAGFAADTAPEGALVAMLSAGGEWVLGETRAEARSLAAKVQGRRSTLEATPPLDLPEGDWVAALRTSWVEPAYLETDASWCEPGGEPADPLANGGAFGAKAGSPLPGIARSLADTHGRAVLALWTREDVVRHGPKRPPVAMGMRRDGTGEAVVVASEGHLDAITDSIHSVAPGLEVTGVRRPGPPSSTALRASGWAEAFCLAVAAGLETPLGGLDGDAVRVDLPTGGSASVAIAPTEGRIEVVVDAGGVLDEAVLRSYVIGAVHMAAGWVTSEGLAVDAEGVLHDLTIRSFGILGAGDLPHVDVRSIGSGEPVAVSDAVFVAAAAAIWRHHGHRTDWPIGTTVL